VSNYVQHIINSFFVSKAKHYDVKGKTYFKHPNKYYYTDIDLRNARLNYRQYNPEHIMENIIFKKIIVRMDIPHNFCDYNGIFHCNLINLLLSLVELF